MMEEEEIKELFYNSMLVESKTSAFVFSEYEGLENHDDSHFQSNFGDNSVSFVSEMIAIWKVVKPAIANSADLAGIIGLLITIKQGAKSKESDVALKRILDELEKQNDES